MFFLFKPLNWSVLLPSLLLIIKCLFYFINQTSWINKDILIIWTRGGSSGRGKKIPKRKRRESGDIVEQAMEETKLFDVENNKRHVKKSSSLVITPVPSKPKTDDFGQTSQKHLFSLATFTSVIVDT